MPTLECTQQKLCGDRGNTFVGPKTQPIRRRRQLMRFGIDLRTVEAKFLLLLLLLLISSPLLRAQTWARWRKSGCRRAKLCAIDRVDAGLVACSSTANIPWYASRLYPAALPFPSIPSMLGEEETPYTDGRRRKVVAYPFRLPCSFPLE